MPALPPNTTPTYFLDYTFNGLERSMQFRSAVGIPPGNLASLVGDFVTALAPALAAGWQITGARYRANGSNVTLPADAPLTPTVSTSALLEVKNPRFVTFTGRGATTGRKVRIHVYGLNIPEEPDYRLEVGDVTALDNARVVLDGAPTGYFTTVAGDNPLWYLYYNWGFNSYHERKARQ